MIFEYASQLAQFRTGALDTMEVAQEDVLVTKRDNQKLLMLGNTEFDRTPFWLRFGYLPGSPFRDERVRKAVSMSTDRDLYVDTFGNVETFRKQGLESPAAWHSCFGAGEPSWLDPKDTKAFGENAKWYRFDPAEAKKLMTAAGFEDRWRPSSRSRVTPARARSLVPRRCWPACGTPTACSTSR